ncbi:MAG: hypothetical protein L6Q76_35990, partial [Polyangiaceae bacterium]|nr:hypothetical protein [Polyangiaceae bacterium]
TGNLGGRVGGHLLCAAEFSGAHLCHASEFLLTNSLVTPPAAGAWIDPSAAPDDTTTYAGAPAYGRRIGGADCANWTNGTSGAYAPHVDANGGISNSGTCAAVRTLACCNGLPKVEFMGVTSSYSAMGGRTAMHQACAAEYPESHFCHAAEYLRASSSITIPSEGAWIDPSVDFQASTTYSGSPLFGRQIGGADCSNWTNTTSSAYGPHIDANGGISNSGTCVAQRYIACCK